MISKSDHIFHYVVVRLSILVWTKTDLGGLRIAYLPLMVCVCVVAENFHYLEEKISGTLFFQNFAGNLKAPINIKQSTDPAI